MFASVHDAIMAGVAMLIAIAGRYGIDHMPAPALVAAWTLAFAAIAALAFRLFGLGRGMWRFASITDLRAIVLASATTVIAFVVLLFLVNRLEGFPRTAPVVAWFVMIVLIGAPRLAYRAVKDGGLAHVRPRDLAPDGVTNLLLVGSATECDRVIRAYGLERASNYRVHGIIDYNSSKRGRDVRGIPIVGDLSEIEEIVARLSRGGVALDAAVIAAPNADRDRTQRLAATAARIGLPLRRVSARPLTGDGPDLAALTLEDLLGRQPVRLDLETIRSLVAGRVVLITGAGGSIGSEIARQIASRRPGRLVLLDSSEYALYEIDQELGRSAPCVDRTAVIADVRDATRIAALMSEVRPNVVFHAAALKHVPLVEANPCEGVLTNVIGTRNVADAAVAADVEAVVMISTDKAIRPMSVMGASKRAAEAYCQALDVSGVRTRFITVRFGNVLGSTGSVVPLFRRQIEAGGPVTVTDPEMRRYFMTVSEATELVLQAAARGIDRPEQRGRVCVLDMGEPIKIVDLARTMIALAGLRPEIDVPIEFTGLRPGEKLFEELFEAGESTVPSGADGVFVATARLIDASTIREIIAKLEAHATAGRADETIRALASITPTLRHGPRTPMSHENVFVLPTARRTEAGAEGGRSG